MANDHGVALAILTDGLESPRLRIQCECGWHDSCAEVIAFDSVDRSVTRHLYDVGAEVRPQILKAVALQMFGCIQRVEYPPESHIRTWASALGEEYNPDRGWRVDDGE